MQRELETICQKERLRYLVENAVIEDPYINDADLYEEAKSIWPKLTKEFFDRVYRGCLFNLQETQFS